MTSMQRQMQHTSSKKFEA